MREFTSNTSIVSKEKIKYWLMDGEDILKEINRTVSQVKDLLGLQSSTLTRILLNHYHWDTQLLTDRYWEDSERVFRELKLSVDNAESKKSASKLIHANGSKKLLLCETCYHEVNIDQFYSLKCGHYQCLNCWKCYLEAKLTAVNEKKVLFCPSMCNELLEDDEFFRLVGNNKNLKNLFEQSVIDSFIDSNRLTRWCPGMGCLRVIKLASMITDKARIISCDTCSLEFCFQCSHDWHDPIQCSLLGKWQKKIGDESRTNQWLVANTKECPKCATNIEKNGGCNHMTCQKTGCRYEFCWICLGSWPEHSVKQCNVFKEVDKNKNQSKKRENLDRFVHYSSRYEAHHQSMSFETELKSKVDNFTVEPAARGRMYSLSKTWNRSISVLLSCRRTLKYTYVFGYYLYRNNQAEVFEANQADLERATETLSRDLESPNAFDATILDALNDKTDYCEVRRLKLLDHCKEGYSEHYWANLDPY